MHLLCHRHQAGNVKSDEDQACERQATGQPENTRSLQKGNLHLTLAHGGIWLFHLSTCSRRNHKPKMKSFASVTANQDLITMLNLSQKCDLSTANRKFPDQHWWGHVRDENLVIPSPPKENSLARKNPYPFFFFLSFANNFLEPPTCL